MMTEQEFDRFIKNAALLLSVQNIKTEIMIEESNARREEIYKKHIADMNEMDRRLSELEIILNVKPDKKIITRPWQDEK